MSILDKAEGYLLSNLLIMSVPDEGYLASNLLTLSIPDKDYLAF